MNAKKHEAVGTEDIFSALKDKALELGLSPFELAGRLQMAYAYWSALNKGKKSVAGLTSTGLDSLIEFVKAPASQIAALAGIVFPEQFIKATSAEDQLARALDRMREDPVWGQFAPNDEEWRNTPIKVKIALALIYEQLFQRMLIEQANTAGGTDALAPRKKRKAAQKSGRTPRRSSQ